MSDTPCERIRKMMQDADDNNVPAHHRPGLVMSLLRQFGDELAAMTAERDALQRRLVATVQENPRQLWNVAASELRDELTAMTARAELAERQVEAFKRKREVDGMCGRMWDSTEHLVHEREVARLLGEPMWKWKAGI